MPNVSTDTLIKTIRAIEMLIEKPKDKRAIDSAKFWINVLKIDGLRLHIKGTR